MRLTFLHIILLIFATTGYAFPSDPEERYSEPGRSRTWDAIKDFFRPAIGWFRKELPEKSPDDFIEGVKASATDAKDWLSKSDIVRGASEAIQPVQTWIKDTANTLREKPLRSMYEDVRESLRGADETVGGWINNYTKS